MKKKETNFSARMSFIVTLQSDFLISHGTQHTHIQMIKLKASRIDFRFSISVICCYQMNATEKKREFVIL